MENWRIYKRKGGALRKLASRGDKDYDGSNWFLHKSYKSETDAVKALELLTDRHTLPGGLKRFQFVIVSPTQTPPKTH